MSYAKPMKGEQSPVIVEESGRGRHNEQRITHPAFGQISVTRGSVGGRGLNLYDSDFGHNEVISIEIKHSELNRGLSRDWHHPRGEIVHLTMSAAQWATFVSSFNVGGGVPCTLTWEKGVGGIPGIPAVDRAATYKHDMKSTTNEAVTQLKKLRKEVEESGLSKKKQDALLSTLHQAEMAVGSSIEFVRDQFDEHIENVIEKSKVEVENYLTSRIQRSGLAALQKAETQILALDDSDRLE